MKVRLSQIKMSENAIRRTYTGINQLMDSIKSNGLLQPIVLKDRGKETGPKYEIVAGHRRFLATKKLGYKAVEANVLEFESRSEAVLAQMAENLSRVDVSLEEFGVALKDLKDQGLSTKEIASRIGIDAQKVKIAQKALHAIPERHHSKIKRNPKERGKFSFNKANAIVSAQKSYRLSKKQVDDLAQHFSCYGEEKIRAAAVALKSGNTVKSIKSNLDSIIQSKVVFNVNKTKRDRWEKAHGRKFIDFCQDILKENAQAKKVLA